MKVLLVTFLMVGSMANAGYTRKHIEESCERYKQERLKKLAKDRVRSQVKGYKDFFIMSSGLETFECQGLIKKLEEDHK